MLDSKPLLSELYFVGDILKLLGLKNQTELWLLIRNGRFPSPKRICLRVWPKESINKLLTEDDDEPPEPPIAKRRQAGGKP